MQYIRNSLLAGLLAGLVTLPAGTAAATGQSAAELKEFEVVPCLLPSRVRRVGGLVYPERRQLTQTTVKNCELRGGEYTVYDRATPESSVAFFLPLAEAGDTTAQTRLGEVYQYLFAEPRYTDAAAWYQRAAALGDLTAKRRLAHLHENGLGVPRDSLLATNLWREAVGLQEGLVLASELDAARSAAEARIATVTAQLKARNAETDALRLELEAAQQALSERRSGVQRAEQELAVLRQELAAARESAAPSDSGRVATLEQQLLEQQRQVEDQHYQLESLAASLDAQQATLTASLRRVELENQRLQTELERVTAVSELELAEARNQLAVRDQEVSSLHAQQETLDAQLAQERNTLATLDAQLDSLRAAASAGERSGQEQLERLAAERVRQAEVLAQRERDIAALQGSLASAETEARGLRAQLDGALDERQQAEARLAQTEAELVRLRQREATAVAEAEGLAAEVTLARRERDALQAEIAAAGSTRSDDAAQLRTALAQREELLAQQEVRLTALRTEATRYRTEVEQLREQWNLQVATRSVMEPLPDTSRLRMPSDVKLGRFYALVIGNNNYEHLRKLSFAHNDARAVHEVLSQRYRFEAELLLDATRSDIFRRVDALKDVLKPEDSLLIYYAGHGSEDGTDSYWMGVDAVSVSPGAQEMYGVSSSALARWLAMLPANHVMVIADSCYSGRGIVTSGGIKLREEEIQKNMKFYLSNRARTVLTSGGVVPVPDGGAGNHSVFTKALVGLLSQNQGVLFDNDLYAHLKERVRFATDANVSVPEPIFGRIEINDGHGSGQFAFLHPNMLGRR